MIQRLKLKIRGQNLFPIDVKSLKGVTQDSRQVKDGYLFAAFHGGAVDGSSFIDDALKRGASVILSDNNSDNPRRDFSHIVSGFYKKQPENITAVTGTNGKSSVVHFIDQILQGAGVNSAYMGTLSGSMTTPDPVSLHKALAEMVSDNITHVALEASSHGLGQYRMDGVRLKVAAFTNLSQDHLDYHGGMDDYFEAKKRLFSEILPKGGVAVLNADVPQYKDLSALCKKREIKVISYGENAEEIKLESCIISGLGHDVVIEVLGSNYSLHIPFIGRFQIMNILCALACVVAQDGYRSSFVISYIDMLKKLKSVPGRLQYVHGDSCNVYVDYAHTPDALENVLVTLRSHAKGKLVCVFGCGGDRDKLKRPLMGGIAAKNADIVIVTDDNPRSENPDDIRREIIGGTDLKDINEIADRRAAIEFAVKQLGDDDILLVAGKGHEQGQVFDGYVLPFDDVQVVEEALGVTC